MNARRVNGANGCGGEKLYRNVLALQQNLKNLGEVALHATLDRSKQFYMVLRDGDARVSAFTVGLDWQHGDITFLGIWRNGEA